jgi:ribosomal protein L34
MSEIDENHVIHNDENANHSNETFHPTSFTGSPTKVLKGPTITMTSTVETMDSLENGNMEEEEQKLSRRMEIMLKKEQQRKEEEENLTFQPKLFTTSFYHKKQLEVGKTGDVNSPTKSTSGFSDDNNLEGSPGKNLFDRLYSDALRRHYIHIHDVKELPSAPNHDLSIVLVNSKDYTFQPKITTRGRKSEPHSAIKRAVGSTSSASSSRAPSAERQPKEISRQPSGDHNQEKSKSKDNENGLFQPKITKRAKSMGRLIDKDKDKDVSQRLYENSYVYKEKLERKKTEKDLKELELCTFQPLLNRSKRQSLSSVSASSSRASSRASSPVSISSRRNNNDDFYHRLNHYQEKKNLSLQVAKEQKEMNESCSFQPILYTRSSSFHTNSTSRDIPFYERLSEKQQQQQQRRRSVSDIDKECTFHPKIKSKRTPSVSDILLF